MTANDNYMEFNMNHAVWVKMTEAGKTEHRRQHDAFIEEWPQLDVDYKPIVEDASGWSEWQLWELMRKFGPKLYNGCNVPFETTMRIGTDGI